MSHGLKTKGGSKEVFDYFFEQNSMAKRTFCPQEVKNPTDQMAVWYKDNLQPAIEKLISNVVSKAAASENAEIDENVQ